MYLHVFACVQNEIFSIKTYLQKSFLQPSRALSIFGLLELLKDVLQYQYLMLQNAQWFYIIKFTFFKTVLSI